MNPTERRSLIADRSGIAAIEFALLLPVLLVIYFGIVELVQAVTVGRLVAQTSSTVTNIVSQYTTISASTQMPDVLGASSQILAPYPSASAGIIVSLISVDNNGNATIAWSQSQNATAHSTGQAVTLPASLDVPNSSVVWGEVSYAYAPIFDFLNLGPFNMYDSVYMLPRNATTINLAS